MGKDAGNGNGAGLGSTDRVGNMVGSLDGRPDGLAWSDAGDAEGKPATTEGRNDGPDVG